MQQLSLCGRCTQAALPIPCAPSSSCLTVRQPSVSTKNCCAPPLTDKLVKRLVTPGLLLSCRPLSARPVLSSQVAKLVKWLMAPNPADRPTAREVLRSEVLPPAVGDEQMVDLLRSLPDK